MQKDILEKFTRMDHLISIKGTGSPPSLAKRLGISERMLYHYINMMKDMGAPIKYDKKRMTYFYEECGSFKIKFEKQTEI